MRRLPCSCTRQSTAAHLCNERRLEQSISRQRILFFVERRSGDSQHFSNMSQEKKMNALKELATILKDKGTPAPELWKAGGFAAAKRLKDVEQAIVALRKTFSVETKAKSADEERAEAEAAGLSLEELREQNKKKRDTEHQQDKRRLDDERKEGRNTKENLAKLAQGQFDLQTDYVSAD